MKGLADKLKKLDQKLPIVFSKKYGNQADVVSYYNTNQLAYRLLHNRHGFMHMGISQSEKLRPGDLLESLRRISKEIETRKATTVVELGSGQGANLGWLAKKHPNVKFYGIDLAPTKNRLPRNVTVLKGDYHDLSLLQGEKVDIFYSIEALCYSSNKAKIFSQVRERLSDNGVCVVFDAYRAGNPASLSATQQKAMVLVEKGMSVNHFEQLDSFGANIKNSGLVVHSKEELSQEITPTAKRFETLARIFFKLPVWVIKLTRSMLSDTFLQNVISGYLMVNLLSDGAFVYYQHIITSIES